MRNKLFLKKLMKNFKLLQFWPFLFSSFMLRTSTSLNILTPSQSIHDGETLISPEGIYELGFFSPGNSKSWYLGIWYYNISPLTVVWVANRETPLNNSSGVLKLIDQGLLIVINGTNSTVWSSNMSGEASNPIAQLLDSGNLVVKDIKINVTTTNEENFVWQSFDYPSDTLLPGMKLGWNLVTGKDWFLSSWKSADDPGHGEYIFKIDCRGYPQAVQLRGNDTMTRVGPWNGLTFSSVPIDKEIQNYKSEFALNEKEIFYEFQLINNSSFIRIVMNHLGNRQLFYRTSGTSSWKCFSTEPSVDCDNYALCGANSICDDTCTPNCACLDGFLPKTLAEWNRKHWSNGCVRISPLSCSKDEFRKYTGMKLPDTSSSWYNQTMLFRECADLCLKNCSCTAYANLDIRGGGSGCLLWFHDLIDMRHFPKGGQDIYIRFPISELDHNQNSWYSKKKLAGIVVGSSVFIISTILGLALCVWKNKLVKPGVLAIILWKEWICKRKREDIGLPEFDLSTLVYVTNGFSSHNKLGEGGFGPVYKGILANGTEIAVKRLCKNSDQGLQEFKTEVQLIAKLQHRNLVKLLGYCIQQKEKLLVYEFMPNRSLDYFIFGSYLNPSEFKVLFYNYLEEHIMLTLDVINMSDNGRRKLLDWTKRFQIIIGIARGLLYLHQDSRLRIIHRDLKTSNILLGNDMNPKISDFGLARTFGGNQTEDKTKRVMGTHGYISPEYAVHGSFSMKSDVFSFGVIVLEVVSGRKNREFSVPHHDLNLLGHAWKLWSEDRPLEVVDESLGDSLNEAQVLRCIHMGLLCVQERPEDRPNMSSVILMLNDDDKPLSKPRQPAFYPHQERSSSTKSELCSKNECSITLLEAR